jgi:hypothetical protein
MNNILMKLPFFLNKVKRKILNDYKLPIPGIRKFKALKRAYCLNSKDICSNRVRIHRIEHVTLSTVASLKHQ